MGTLYLVSTPIGNLKDITLRALEILKDVDLIVCEDTRRTSKLLREYKIEKPLLSYFEHNEVKRLPELLERLREGQRIALVSDAGTPLISDPGFKLVRECLKNYIKVESIPGPSAILAALVTAGLPTDKFIFLGYLPKKRGKRETLLKSLVETPGNLKCTVIFFESPYRILRTLEEIQNLLGNIPIVVARELTKIHEEFLRRRVSDAIGHFKKTTPKGEFTVLLSAALE